MKKVRFDYFMVHFNTDQRTIEFIVYPVVDCSGPKGYRVAYIDMSESFELLNEFDEKKATSRYKGSICWRGVWEGRIYFTDNEYRGEELKEMANLYENKIVPWCKDFIKSREPYGYYGD